jgi:glutamate-1-semialdehyde 2,1-aminomutase
MGAMQEFLLRLERPELKEIYRDLDATWNQRAARLNERLAAERLPLEVKNLQTIWTICYTQPGRYNWMLQYYLRAAGLFLSWVGTGRFIFSLDYPEADFEAVCGKLIAGARQMEEDGFFWKDPAITNKAIRRRILKEMISHRF